MSQSFKALKSEAPRSRHHQESSSESEQEGHLELMVEFEELEKEVNQELLISEKSVIMIKD